ncbi:MAG TPA: tetratricopeptide repeat protein [Herpetosiphonaceae bacterium]
MSDEPAASASIRDSTISHSTVNFTTQVTHQAHPWQPRWEPPLDQAQDLLDALLASALPPISPLPSGARMPFAANPHFVGRDDVLLALARTLHGGARMTIGPKAAVTGLGGIGKTSVAVEIAHRYGSYFAGGVFWLSFADPAAIPAEIAACGGPGLLDLHPSYGELKQDEQLALVREAWQRPIPRLLIFDNAEDPQLVQQWAPSSGGCRVLITSRRQSWPGRIVTHSLDVLARAASAALLRDLAPRLTPEDADALAEELGDFPLALQLAGSYLAQFGRISVAGYLAELRSDVILAHPSLRGIHDGDVSTTAHDRHVGRTFLVSYQRLDPAGDKLALGLLARAAFLAPGTPIPLDLLLASVDLSAEDTGGHMALGRLADLGFVTLGEDGVAVHRLVHSFVSNVVQAEGAQAAVETALIAAAAATNDAGYPAATAPLLGHLGWIIQQGAGREDLAMAALCSNLGYHYYAIGDFPMARPLYARALAIHDHFHAAAHPDVAQSLTNLAASAKAMGDYAAARPLYERASRIYEQVWGPQHPQTAIGLTNLGGLLEALGDAVGARTLHARALAICEQTLDPTHPLVASSLNNLAYALQASGDAAGARPLYERALTIRTAQLGPGHPLTANSMNNLAGLLQQLGDAAAARSLYERALVISRQALGHEHPQTRLVMANLDHLGAQAKERE